jgi:hypothetical protein
MKTQPVLFKMAVLTALFFTVILGNKLHAQEEAPTIYFEITKIKKLTDDFQDVHEELAKPFIQERIKAGNQLAHALFRVYSPYSDDANYDYIMMDVFGDFNHLNMGKEVMGKMAYSIFPNANIPKMIDRWNEAVHTASSEVFLVRDEAFPGSKGGSDKMPKFVQVNHMKVSEANSGNYSKMESEIFKPIHQARAKEGNLHDWILAQRIMPYGSDWDNNFLTFDIYSEWGDMAGGGMGDLFSKVHPDENPNDIWDKMATLRDLRRAETWELIAVIDKPTPEVTYETVKEGTGTYPMLGQEVAFEGTMLDMDGNVLFRTSELGFDFHYVVGENMYDRYFEKGLKKAKKGGIFKMSIPASIQDEMTKNISGGQDAVMQIELKDIAKPQPNGAKLLKESIIEDGLAAGKALYKKLKSNNPEGYTFREGDMNSLGYMLIKEGHNDAAIYVFELNQKNHPKSWNACDSLADGYKAAGDYAQAKHCYEMALKINPDFKSAKEKLAKL